MKDKNRTARDAALACTFIVMNDIRHAFPDEELQAVFEEIRDAVEGAIQAAFAAQDEGLRPNR